MSTPEEQQHQQHQQHQRENRHGPQPQPHEPDPYGTQTWQTETWDTGYQPVQPPAPVLGGVPGQPVAPAAPEGWFRDEAPGAAYPAQAQPQQPAAPEGWFRDEAPAPAQVPAPAAAPDWAETAYLPPVRENRESVAPEGWFRDEAPAQPQETPYLPPQAPVPDWAEATAYLPPVESAAEATAYLPPVGDRASRGAHARVPEVSPESAAEATAYLPPVGDRASRGAHARVPEVSPESAAEATAYLPPVGAQGAAEATAYLPPVGAQAAAEATAYLPPVVDAPQGPGAPEEEPEYSPPTVGGNTLRAVDPAQARAEGRSPIIDPGPQSAILTAALGLLLAGTAALGDLALLVPLVALQGLTAAGWFRLNGMWPARQGIVLAFAGALVADAAVLAVDDSYGPGAIIGTLGAWVLLTLVLQLRSHADPDERMYGLMASVASAALAIVCAGYLAAGSEAVSVGAAAVAVAVFARALPLPTMPSVGVSLAAAAGAGIAVGTMAGVGAGGALIGLAAGVCALIGLRVAAYDYPSKFVHMTAGVALPLAAAAPAVYLLGRVVG